MTRNQPYKFSVVSSATTAPVASLLRKLAWLIRASRLIEGPMIPRINLITRIHHVDHGAPLPGQAPGRRPQVTGDVAKAWVTPVADARRVMATAGRRVMA